MAKKFTLKLLALLVSLSVYLWVTAALALVHLNVAGNYLIPVVAGTVSYKLYKLLVKKEEHEQI